VGEEKMMENEGITRDVDDKKQDTTSSRLEPVMSMKNKPLILANP
jgi:hypothetical protein